MLGQRQDMYSGGEGCGELRDSDRSITVAARRTCLDYIDADILNAGLDLLFHKSGRDSVYSFDTGGILCGQSSRSRHGIAAMGGKDFLVGLQASVAEARKEKITQVSQNGLWQQSRNGDSLPFADCMTRIKVEICQGRTAI